MPINNQRSTEPAPTPKSLRTLIRGAQRKFACVLACFCCLAFGRLSWAQTVSVFDGATPVGVAPGTPAGSSALSGFENYNPFSGGFSAALPLYHVGGRGEAGFDLMWSFQQTWVAAKRYGGVNPLIPINLYPDADISGTSNVLGMLGAGAVFVRTGSNFISCPNTGNATGSTLARVVFEAPNGTQIELMDQNTNGAVYNLSNACSQSAGSLNAGRGTLFRSDDGSGIVFVADAPVMDTLAPGFGEADTKVSGTLRFPNGVAYRVDKSDISWVEDRNGNRTVLQYNSGLLQAVTWYLTVDAPSTIIDPLGRSIQIKYNDSTCSGCTTITTPGMGGAPRVIKIMQAHLSQGLLRDSGGVKTLVACPSNTYSMIGASL